MATKKKMSLLSRVFIIAVFLVVITLVILWTVFGLRYTNDKLHELKFVGRVENGEIVSGKLYYYDGRIAELDAENKTIRFENGEKYIGALSGYLPHGYGTLTKADGTILEGDFYEGYATGKLQVTYSNGDVYKGELDHEKRQGVGEYISRDGTRYQGDFIDGEKYGFGMTHFPDGSVYVGQYASSVKNGVGAYLFSNGDMYVGDFKDDARTGRGIYVWGKSEEYSSEFEDLFDLSLENGFKESFLAYFESDFERHFTQEPAGQATTENTFFITFESILSRRQIESYIGGFLNGELSGDGVYRWLSGRVQRGTFSEGAVIGEGSDADADK